MNPIQSYQHFATLTNLIHSQVLKQNQKRKKLNAKALFNGACEVKYGKVFFGWRSQTNTTNSNNSNSNSATNNKSQVKPILNSIS